MKILSIVTPTLLLLFQSAEAQWRNVAPNLVPPSASGYWGAMTYADGRITGAFFGTKICTSTDEGKTWNTQQPPYASGEEPLDMDFFDRNNGIIATYRSGLLLTRDGGLTWNRIGPFSSVKSAKFMDTDDKIVVQAYYGHVFFSGDGGSTFSQITPASFSGGNYIQVRKSDLSIHTLAVPSTGGGLQGSILSTSDRGITWNRSQASFYSDCYNFTVSECDLGAFYVMNEGNVTPGPDGMGRVYHSHDAGATFQEANPQGQSYYCGSIISAPGGTLYAQTQQDGILRSTDKGVSWVSIGGPNGTSDCHWICCKDDNTIFALAKDGSVWATMNSGGDSVRVNTQFSISEDSLFVTDSLLCGDSVTRTIQLSKSPCSVLASITATLIGQDSMSYQIVDVTSDSVSIRFLPLRTGSNAAHLVVSAPSVGTSDTIRLGGYKFSGIPQTIFSTADQHTDTLGGEVTVPLNLDSPHSADSLRVVLHYDPALEYIASYSPQNEVLDVVGEQWAGRSLLCIRNVVAGSVLGYSRFRVFSGPLVGYRVSFDSMVVAKSNCEQFVSVPVLATVVPPNGCGIDLLSNFLRTGNMPRVTIRPNPAEDLITIHTGIGSALDITIVDQLGKEHIRRACVVTPLSLSVESLPNGLYMIYVKSTGFVSSNRLMISR